MPTTLNPDPYRIEVHSADDFLWFVMLNRDLLTDTCAVLCLVCTGACVPTAAVVTLKEPEVSICFFSTSACFVCVFLLWLRSLCCSIFHHAGMTSKSREVLIKLVKTVYSNTSLSDAGSHGLGVSMM